MFEDIQDWHNYVINNWLQLKQKTEEFNFNSYYQILLSIALIPALPTKLEELSSFLNLVASERYTRPLVDRLNLLYDSVNFSELTVQYIVNYVATHAINRPDELRGVERIILVTGALAGSQIEGKGNTEFVEHVFAYLRETVREPSAVRVQADMITAGQNVIVAGHDVNVVSKYYEGNHAKLKAYLGNLRAEWNQPDLGQILPGYSGGTVRLHHLYTPVDIWRDVIYDEADEEELAELRYSAVDEERNSARVPALEAIASKPLIIITGGAGTGKSTLARYITISLSYACDPDAERDDNVKGLDLLGPAWIHGAVLPLYVRLVNFVSDKKSFFPETLEDATSRNLLDFLRDKADTFAPDLENYLTHTEVPVHGSILILDGLDEVLGELKREILQKIIMQWVFRFPKCRVLITSRNYAFRKSAEFNLSDRFVSAELAPYTPRQIQAYIQNWYAKAAIFRPAKFGGREFAEERTSALAKSLLKAIVVEKRELRPLAKQPLLLTLITLIHEDSKRLPERRAELYENTVELLNRWNVPIDEQHLSIALADIKLTQVRLALQLLAFDLQRDRALERQYPPFITPDALRKKLEYQEKKAGGSGSLGAPVSVILSYLASRNGILIADSEGGYRFPHLTIQEYLAACALVEQYDECEMPITVKKEEPAEGWAFPENIAALVGNDPHRWRGVAVFTGSILATGKGQDRRWELIQALLPMSRRMVTEHVEGKSLLAEEALYGIYIAASVWKESTLIPRRVAQEAIKNHLIACLEAIRIDERLEERDRAEAISIHDHLITEIIS